MSRRSPRFSYIHTLRAIGDGGFTGSTSAFELDTPRTRLFDDQSTNLCGQGDGIKVIEFEQSPQIGAGHPNLNRIIIPAGHNFGLDRQIRFELDATDIKLSDLSTIERVAPSSGLIDIELNPLGNLDEAFTLKISHWSSGTSILPGLGEIWWTQTISPTTGNAAGWDDEYEPVRTRTETESGGTFNRIDGPSKRRWTLEHEGISGADKRLYDELLRRVGYGNFPFWYEHPDSGDPVTLINPLDDHTSAGISIGAGDLGTVVTGAPDGGDAISWTSDSAARMSLNIDQAAYPSGAALDLRNTILQFDIKIVADAAWLAANDDFNLFIQSSDPLQDPSSTTYRVANPLFPDTIIDEWIRVQIDVEQDATLTTGTRPGVDLSNVTRLQFDVDTLATLKELQIANMRFIDKTKQPVLVEIPPRGYRQKHRFSNAVSFWDVELDLVEVTT